MQRNIVLMTLNFNILPKYMYLTHSIIQKTKPNNCYNKLSRHY